MSPTILVVDDDPAVVDVLRETLRPRQIQLEVAPDASAAVRLLEEASPCGVVLDLSRGADVLRHMAEQSIRVPIVVIGSGLPEDARSLPVAKEIRLVIRKPIDRALLAAVALGLCGIAP